MLYAPILYPKTYAAFLMVAAMDVICTWVVLALGGREINAFADMFLQRWDVQGLLALKFGVCVMFLVTCEFIGRRQPLTAVRLATAAIVLNCFPVIVGSAQVVGFLMAQP
ncbi:MAG: hypothetical protein KF805_10110 [Phycisphaeraceae bacterium]|nr:hypothetical protein [Phycisphaeraceae bacterium]